MSIIQKKTRIQYTAGASAEFSIPFKFETNSDIEIYQKETKLNASKYTLVGAGILDDNETRTVTLDPAPIVGDVITILRKSPIERTSKFQVSGDFSSVNVDAEFDRMILMMQEMDTTINDLMIKYEPYIDETDGASINTISKFPAKTDDSIPVLSTNAAGDLAMYLLSEDPNWSTLASILANAQEGTDGSGSIGIYDTVANSPTTVRDMLTSINQHVSGENLPTGAQVDFYGNFAPDGWLLMDDGTIGNVNSGASNMQDIACHNLFVQLWNYTTIDNQWLPVYDSIGGPATRGASAEADWISLKRLSLPKSNNRVFAGVKRMVVTSVFTALGSILTLQDAEKASSAFPHGSIVRVLSTNTLPSGLASGTDYYVIANDSSTIKLAANANDAVLEVPINIIIGDTSTGVLTITRTMALRSPCEWGGEDDHLNTIPEMANHDHDYTMPNGTEPQSGSTVYCYNSVSTTKTSSAGGSIPAPIRQPTTYVDRIIKL